MGSGHSVATVEVQVDRPAYHVGETVTGRVFLVVERSFESRGLDVEVKGHERVEFDESETSSSGKVTTTRTVRRHEKRSFFHFKIPLYAFPGGLCEPGQFAFPFSFQLPPDLPETFVDEGYEGGWWRARIVYKVKADLDRRGMLKSDIKKAKEFVVHALRPDAIPAPVRREIRSNVTFCCCVKRGMATMRGVTDKACYSPGEVAQVTCEVENMSTVRLPHLRTLLKRRMELKAHGHRKAFSLTISRAVYDGVAPMTAQTGQTARYIPLMLSPFRHNGRLPPQSSGLLMRCEYWLDVQLHVPWSPDIHLQLPVNIVAQAPTEQEWTAAISAPPPDWNPTVYAPMAIPVAADPRAAQDLAKLKAEADAQSREYSGVAV